jgi:ACS family tartrate transporter-like MFS transporter
MWPRPAHHAFSFFSMSLLCFVAIGAYGFMGPVWALPSEFLTGLSAAAGLALINSVGNLAGFVGPYAIGAISKTTGSLYAGLAFAGVFMFAAAILVLRLPKSAESDALNDDKQVKY